MNTGIIILAAGSSSRLGRPKQLLSYEGKSLLTRAVDNALVNPAHRAVVVLGALQDEYLLDSLEMPRLHTVINDKWQQGMASSIKTGLQALLENAPGLRQCIIMVCDQPLVTASLLEELKQLATKTGKGIITTGYNQTWGVPALFDKQYFSRLARMNSPSGAKELILRHEADMAIFPYEPAGLDIDTLADYCKLSHQMVSVEEARMIIDFHLPEPAVSKSVEIERAAGYTLASDVTAPLSIPHFEQSSMDGYALRYQDRDHELVVTDTIPAGTTVEKEIGPGQAMRIFTGAPLPKGADTIVIQEKAQISSVGTLLVKEGELSLGDHVRRVGSEVARGDVAMVAGTHLTPAATGYLAGIGHTHVDVYGPPRVTILLTGDELRPAGTALKLGEVYESNSIQLKAALKQLGVNEVESMHVGDDAKQLKSVIENALKSTDILMLVGGVSVGDYDFVSQAIKDCGVQQHFHRVRQKPGKPLLFGTCGRKLVFGLPGNPSSALTCFYLYIAPFLRKLMKLPREPKELKAEVTSEYNKKPGLTHFLKAWYDGKVVTPLHAQESYRLQSYARANCLLVLPEQSHGCRQGEEVEVILL